MIDYKITDPRESRICSLQLSETEALVVVRKASEYSESLDMSMRSSFRKIRRPVRVY